jgi:hypothetical protein
VTAANVTFDAARITWGASSDADGDPVTYEIEIKPQDVASWTPARTTTSAYRDFTALNPHTAYYARVRATDGSGGASDWQTATPAFTTANHLPSVSITNLSAGTLFTAPAAIAISASATDTDGTIAKVEFFAGTTKLGEASTSPYSYLWQNVPRGTYTLTAKATDDSGGEATSASVQIVVNELPTVGILTSAKILSGGAVQFGFTNTPGALFTVLVATNVSLPLSQWTALSAVTEVSPGRFQFTDPQAVNYTQRFYCVRTGLITGTAPLVLTNGAKVVKGAFQFAFINTPGAVFTVLSTTNSALPLSNWTVLGGVTEVSPGQFQFTDPQATNTSRRFYRVRSP